MAAPVGEGDWKIKEKRVCSRVSGGSYKMGVEQRRLWGDRIEGAEFSARSGEKTALLFLSSVKRWCWEFSCSVVSDSGGAVGDALWFPSGQRK